MADQHLLSPARLLRALRRWIWWAGDQGLCFPFWYFMRFEGRPLACQKWKQTHKPPELWWRKGAYE